MHPAELQPTHPRQSLAAGRRGALEARAIQRAKDEHIHIFAVAGRPGVYTTCSRSEPGKKHTLVAKAGIEACSCRGFEYRQSCKHVEALRARLAREARKAGLLVLTKEVS